MTDVNVNELAGKLAQGLVDHGIIDEREKGGARMFIFIMLDRELNPLKSEFVGNAEFHEEKNSANY